MAFGWFSAVRLFVWYFGVVYLTWILCGVFGVCLWFSVLGFVLLCDLGLKEMCVGVDVYFMFLLLLGVD